MNFLKLSAIISLLTMSFFGYASEVIKISPQQVFSLQAAKKAPDFIILDTRSEAEFAQGHITGALNISHDQVANQLSKLEKYKDKLVIVHCRSGRRALTAEAALISAGFSQLRHLDGDYKGWVKADLPIVKSN